MRTETAFHLGMDAARRSRSIRTSLDFFKNVIDDESRRDLEDMLAANAKIFMRYVHLVISNHSNEPQYQIDTYIEVLNSEFGDK